MVEVRNYVELQTEFKKVPPEFLETQANKLAIKAVLDFSKQGGKYSKTVLQKSVDYILHNSDCDKLLDGIKENWIHDKRTFEMTLKILTARQHWKSVVPRYKLFYEHHALDAFKLLDQRFKHFISQDLFQELLRRLEKIKEDSSSHTRSHEEVLTDKIVKDEYVTFCEFWRAIKDHNLHEHCEELATVMHR